MSHPQSFCRNPSVCSFVSVCVHHFLAPQIVFVAAGDSKAPAFGRIHHTRTPPDFTLPCLRVRVCAESTPAPSPPPPASVPAPARPRPKPSHVCLRAEVVPNPPPAHPTPPHARARLCIRTRAPLPHPHSLPCAPTAPHPLPTTCAPPPPPCGQIPSNEVVWFVDHAITRTMEDDIDRSKH
jgi:hypothetical protein